MKQPSKNYFVFVFHVVGMHYNFVRFQIENSGLFKYVLLDFSLLLPCW